VLNYEWLNDELRAIGFSRVLVAVSPAKSVMEALDAGQHVLSRRRFSDFP
jgi:hypothetical protein